MLPTVNSPHDGLCNLRAEQLIDEVSVNTYDFNTSSQFYIII